PRPPELGPAVEEQHQGAVARVDAEEPDPVGDDVRLLHGPGTLGAGQAALCTTRVISAAMAIDFSFPPDIEDIRTRVREFMDSEVDPAQDKIRESGGDRKAWIEAIVDLRAKAKEWELWLP